MTRVGGFPSIPLMEDISFSRSLKQHARPCRVTQTTWYLSTTLACTWYSAHDRDHVGVTSCLFRRHQPRTTGKILFGNERMKYPHARLLLLTKAPDPGQVKTRLVPLLGEVAAADLYSQLLDDCLAMCSQAALCPIDIWCSPSTRHPFFQQCRAALPGDPAHASTRRPRTTHVTGSTRQHWPMLITWY